MLLLTFIRGLIYIIYLILFIDFYLHFYLIDYVLQIWYELNTISINSIILPKCVKLLI